MINNITMRYYWVLFCLVIVSVLLLLETESNSTDTSSPINLSNNLTVIPASSFSSQNLNGSFHQYTHPRHIIQRRSPNAILGYLRNVRYIRFLSNKFGNYYERQDQNSSTWTWKSILHGVSRTISRISNAIRGFARRTIERQGAAGALATLQGAAPIVAVSAGLVAQPGSPINNFVVDFIDTLFSTTTTTTTTATTTTTTKASCKHGVVKGCPRDNPGSVVIKSDTSLQDVRCCSTDATTCVVTSPCSEDKTYEEATDICDGLGRRLCLESEINVCCGNGCGFDATDTWVGDCL